MAGGLGLTFPRQKENLTYPPWQVTAIFPCNPSATVLNEEPTFLWTGSLPEPVRAAQGGTCFISADDIKAVVTCCLTSCTSSVLQQLSSLLLPLMVSGSCSEKPTDRNCIGLPGTSHLFPKQTIDVHWVNLNVWMSRSSCGQKRRHGGATQWGQWGLRAMGLETGGDGGSAVTSAPIIPASLKLAKTNWNSWNCPLPPADDQHPLFYLQTYVSLSSKCSWEIWTPLWALTLIY